jgi:hypothetical protein
MNSKAQLGQFMTTRYSYILQGMYIPLGIGNEKYIEPFAGNGDLIQYYVQQGVDAKHIISYDIDPRQEYIQRRDTLKNPPCYKGAFLLTNPPYLARNKAKDKSIFDQYKVNDLYKCLIAELIRPEQQLHGGILIVPLNFWCSNRAADLYLRKQFLIQYQILRLNIFEEQVFDDTTYTVCAFQFERNNRESNQNKIYTVIFPSQVEMFITFTPENNYTIGGEIYRLPVDPTIKIGRYTRQNLQNTPTRIIAKCIDDSKESQIRLFLADDTKDIEPYIDRTPDLSFRSYAVLVVDPVLTDIQQEQLVNEFNLFLNQFRAQTHSLCLPNYRDKYRKRIGFDLVYRIVNYILRTIVLK